MDFETTPDQLELARAVARFAETRLNGDMIQRDRDAEFSREGWNACAEMGLQGLPLPPEFGGQGQDLLTTILVMEALGRACTDNGLVFSLNAQLWSVQMPLLAFGTDEQKARYLPDLCAGRRIGAHGMSEPDSGSDAMAMRTRATREGDGYRLNGRKTFATNGPVADFAVVFATVRPEMKALGVTAFLVDRDTPGVSFGPPIPKMGLRTSPMGDLILEDAEIPASARLGSEGQGLAVFSAAMEWERACIFAANLGAMQRVLDRCIEHARVRKQFGQSIGKFSPIADRLVRAHTEIELARLLLHRLGWRKGRGLDASNDSAMAKLFVSEAHVQLTLDAIQIFGGYGYCTEYEIEREHRDALAGRIYSGTSEIQRKILAHALGL